MSFYKGILPSLRSLGDEEVIHFQNGVLAILQNISKARQPSVSFTNDSLFQTFDIIYPSLSAYHQASSLSSQPPSDSYIKNIPSDPCPGLDILSTVADALISAVQTI